MTILQRHAIEDCIDQRERAYAEGRRDDARTWQRIIEHCIAAYDKPRT